MPPDELSQVIGPTRSAEVLAQFSGPAPGPELAQRAALDLPDPFAGDPEVASNLFEGARPESIDDGMAYTEKVGDEVLRERVDAALADLPDADLAAAHRVFVALTGAMRTFRADTAPGEP